MHRLVEDQLEDVLAGTLPAGHEVYAHLKDCAECREETDGMRAQNELFHAFRAAEAEPMPGFYARVLDRIEAHRPVSIWSLFLDSTFGRSLATASLVLALFTGVYVISAEQSDTDVVASAQAEMDPLYPEARFAKEVMAADSSNTGAVFMSLVSYQER